MKFRLGTLLALVLVAEVLLAFNLRPRFEACGCGLALESAGPRWGWPRAAYGAAACGEGWIAAGLLVNAAVALLILAAAASLVELGLRFFERDEGFTASSRTPSALPSASAARTRS